MSDPGWTTLEHVSVDRKNRIEDPRAPGDSRCLFSAVIQRLDRPGRNERCGQDSRLHHVVVSATERLTEWLPRRQRARQKTCLLLGNTHWEETDRQRLKDEVFL